MRDNRTADRRRCAVLVNDVEVGRLLAENLGPELDVHLVGNIRQASELLDDLRWVDLAFLDLELPDGSCDELLARLARWPDAIRILLDGEAMTEAPNQGAKALKYRHLAHLVLDKPPALGVVLALKSFVLGLSKD